MKNIFLLVFVLLLVAWSDAAQVSDNFELTDDEIEVLSANEKSFNTLYTDFEKANSLEDLYMSL
jgi:hypothetical protein